MKNEQMYSPLFYIFFLAPPTYEESILMERFPDQNTSENISLIAK